MTGRAWGGKLEPDGLERLMCGAVLKPSEQNLSAAEAEVDEMVRWTRAGWDCRVPTDVPGPTAPGIH